LSRTTTLVRLVNVNLSFRSSSLTLRPNTTATLPNEKFYNMEAYERRMNAMRAGEFVPPADDGYDPEADVRAHQNNLKRPAVENESYLDKDQLQELRRVQRERVEVR
jgi:hypothetical protein